MRLVDIIEEARKNLEKAQELVKKIRESNARTEALIAFSRINHMKGDKPLRPN